MTVPSLDDVRRRRALLSLVGNPDGFAREDTDPGNRRPVVDEDTVELPQVTPGNPPGDSGWRRRVHLAARIAAAAARQDGLLLLLAQTYRAGVEDGMAGVRDRLALADDALHRAAADAALDFIDRVQSR